MKDLFVERYIERLEESDSIFDCQAVPVDEITDGQDFLFVSYSHKDYMKVYADLAVMARRGIKFWYDEGLRAGKNWDEEVRKILLHPNCIGVIFFISENLFLSKSVNQEIRLICGKDAQCKKNYFSVNLSQKTPKNILRAVMREDDAVLDEAGLDMERVAALTTAFSDNQTYLRFFQKNHQDELVNEILKQYPTVEGRPTQWERSEPRGEVMCCRLEVKNTGGSIALKHDVFNIGRDIGWADYCVKDPFVGRRHASVIYQQQVCAIVDLGSFNGTFINGRKLDHREFTPLCDGDVIRIGKECEFVFRSEKHINGMLLGSCRAGKTAYLAAYQEQYKK